MSELFSLARGNLQLGVKRPKVDSVRFFLSLKPLHEKGNIENCHN